MRKILFILLAALFLLTIGCAPKMETTGVITHGEAESDGTDSIAALRQLAATDPAAACDLGLALSARRRRSPELLEGD
ncbi:hypothetical protein JWG39_08680 [Desulforhopalus vacuolatus]|uniref:hypothetical protein n=1 Tax=Desulforhopalus vacuolatus TaxID=40414 RepID=UPI001962C73B|nr:hypothetical protein [Desulforhopalus vacuolatus]MBM9519890.1 hypothetical protein [Desulforhopalus vacuolatus]